MKEQKTLREMLDRAIKALPYQMKFTGDSMGSLEPDKEGEWSIRKD